MKNDKKEKTPVVNENIFPEDEPFYFAYNYTSKEYSLKLELDRMDNKTWTDSGYHMSLED